jgi:hypothetical protein
MSERLSVKPILGERAEGFYADQEFEREIRKTIQKIVRPFGIYKRWRNGETTQEENDAVVEIALVEQDIAKYMVEGDPVDLQAVERVAAIAMGGGSSPSFVKAMKDWRKHLTGIHVFRRRCPSYFPKEILEEINEQWGRIDSALIYQKYVLDRIPKEEWPDLRGYMRGSGQ